MPREVREVADLPAPAQALRQQGRERDILIERLRALDAKADLTATDVRAAVKDLVRMAVGG
tara:strand:- start:2671 stop:2853 length:183 start_codon:yes stop_codon:yes gene_type:complete